MRTIKILVVVACFVVLAASLRATGLTFASPGQANQKKAVKAVATADPAQYVGIETCSECHTNESAHFSLTAHRKTLGDSIAVDRRGCEACHGGGRAHAEFHQAAQRLFKEGKDDEATALYADEAKAAAAKMRDIKGLSATEASAVCLKCHEGEQGRNEERFNFRRSEHARHGLSCLDCHSSHAPKRTEFLLRDTQPNMCYECHADQKPSFARPFHHKVPEGGMKCSDCHNQHGSFQPKQLRGWGRGDVTCLKCHADKAGPFVYEHAPVKVEGCQSCHMPHGSTNSKMLTRNEVKFLCLECHSNTPGIPAEDTGVGPPTPSFHNLSSPRYQNCTVCHVAIHGSNVHPAYFR